MTELATLGLSIRSDGVVVATDRLKDFEGAGRRAEDVAGSLARMAAKAGTVLAGAFSIRALQQYADAWSDMQSRVGAAIKDMSAAPAMMQRMVDLANASYSPLEQTVDVYTRNVGVLRDLGVAADGAADFTESLNHMLVITATRGERAASVQNALSKAMATGKLQADGLETVLTSGGRVAEALADELGTTVSGLRGMASQGKITGAVIKNALINSLEVVREEASKMPATIGDAFTRIQTNTTALVGKLDQAWGISGKVAEQMLAMADGIRGNADVLLRLGNIVGSIVGPAMDLLVANMDTVGSVAGVAVAALAGFYTPALISGLWATSTALTVGVAGGIKAISAAMMANPLGLLIAGLAAAVTAAFLFRDQIKQAIGIDVVDVMVDVGDKTIGVFVGAYEAVKEQWSNLPTFFSAIGKVAWNDFLSTFEGPALEIKTPWGSWQSGGLDLSGAKAQLSADERRSFETADGTFNEAFLRRGYIKGISDSVGELWQNAEGASSAMNDLMAATGGAGASPLSKEAQKQADAYAKIISGSREFIAAQTLEQQAIGLTAEAASRMRYEQQLLNQAANDNIKLSPTQRNELMGLAAQMAAVEEATRRVTEIYNFGKDVFTSFFGDLKSGITEGKSLWESLGNAAANALDKIADRAMTMAANGIFDMIFGAVMGGLGGGFGTIGIGGVGMPSGGFIPGLTGPRLFSAGGYTGDMSTSAAAGIVHGQEYVLNASATRRIGLSTLNAMNSGQMPAANQNGGGESSGNVYVTIERIEASSHEGGVAAANGFQAGMRQWKESGEGARYIRGVMSSPGRSNPR